MLKLIENLGADTAEKLSSLLGKELYAQYTLISMLDWYNVNGAWLQECENKITALLVERENAYLYIAASDSADFEEIRAFAASLGGLVVNCRSEITKPLDVGEFSKHSVMTYSGGKESPSGSDKIRVETVTDNLRAVFDLLAQDLNDSFGTETGLSPRKVKKLRDRNYKEWLSKTSRGILNGFTVVKVVKTGENAILSVAVADKVGKSVYIRDVVTDKAFRKMGYAAACVTSLVREMKTEENEIFLVCSDLKTENFYLKCGFERTGYLTLGIY